MNVFLGLNVSAPQQISNDKIAQLIEKLINIGLADATDTLKQGEVDNAEDAKLAASLKFSMPVVTPSSLDIPVKLFHDMESRMTWAVRIIYHGQSYGRFDEVIHDGLEPLVEFFDTRHEHTHLGQFVGRYHLCTLLIRQAGGICLDGGTPSWSISASCMDRITQWLSGIPGALPGDATCLLSILQSNAGFYIGSLDEDGIPNSRASVEYWPTRALAQVAFDGGKWAQRENS